MKELYGLRRKTEKIYKVKLESDLTDLIPYWDYNYKDIVGFLIETKRVTQKQKELIEKFLNKYKLKHKIKENEIELEINEHNREFLFQKQVIKIILRVIMEILSGKIKNDSFKIRLSDIFIDTIKLIEIRKVLNDEYKDIYTFEQFLFEQPLITNRVIDFANPKLDKSIKLYCLMR